MIDRPVFLLGSGRSGTTILYHLLSVHPELCWFSNISNRVPWLSFMPIAHRLLDSGARGERVKQNIINRKGGKLHVRPVEAETLYGRAGFRHDIKTTEDDYDSNVNRRFRKTVESHLRWAGRPRFISKQTANNQRYRLLNRMFPDALFVHLIRDGRAVANSIRGQRWLDSMDLWWLEDKAHKHVDQFDGPIELCGLHWQRNLEELLLAKDLLGERYLEMRYEDLIDDVHGIVKQVLAFSDLDASAAYFSFLPEKLPNMNNKWRDDLSQKQIDALQRVIGPSLQMLGYSA